MSTPEAQPISDQANRLQRWFQAVITHTDGVDTGVGSEEAQRLIQLGPSHLEKVITRARALSAADRLAIYANAYHTRLLECLGEVFPMLKRTFGDEAFDSFAFGYLQEYPPRSYTLNELGRHFSRYLEDTRPATRRNRIRSLERGVISGSSRGMARFPHRHGSVWNGLFTRYLMVLALRASRFCGSTNS